MSFFLQLKAQVRKEQAAATAAVDYAAAAAPSAAAGPDVSVDVHPVPAGYS